jgi:hypothetical protein
MKLRKNKLTKIDIVTYRIFFNGNIENIFRKVIAEMKINTNTSTYKEKAIDLGTIK